MATAQPQRIRLGLFVQPVGQHVSGWRLTEKLGDPTDIDWLITIAKKPKPVNSICSSSVMRWRPACTVCHRPWRALSR